MSAPEAPRIAAPRGLAGQPARREALRRATATLADAGCDSPRLDAELLLSSALGVDRARLTLDGELELDGEAAARFEEMIGRRAAREPVAYILGRKDFRRIVTTVGAIPLVALEVGFDHADAVADLLRSSGFRSIEKRRDLAGHERVVVGRR